jgi:hypothetical protein
MSSFICDFLLFSAVSQWYNYAGNPGFASAAGIDQQPAGS